MAVSKQTVQQIAGIMIKHLGKKKALSMMSEILAKVEGNLSYSTSVANIYNAIDHAAEAPSTKTRRANG
jgi:aerobic-type carbon monoxide dehydrogenase small subunit (CoxS/CutS family)